MPLISAERTAHYARLADDADAALARGDAMGVELLRTLVPELTEAIEEINDGVREVTALLFEGLRDEAIGLHDPALAEVAIRLNLADKPQWPLMAEQFQAAEISLPPELDFDALSALNAAFAEVEQIRRPLDRLRRLVLERAPLAARISLLREIRAIDSSRPAWEEQLAGLESARLAELGPEVSAAIKSGDPERLAVLETEMLCPEWRVVIPARLTQQVQGANAWLRLRQLRKASERLASGMEQEFAPIAAGEDPSADLDRLARLRGLQTRWLAIEPEYRELIFTISKHPIISQFATPEGFGEALEIARSRVEPALCRLAAVDALEQIVDTFSRKCDELMLAVRTLPQSSDIRSWRRRVAQAEAAVGNLQKMTPGLDVPPHLQEAVARASRIVARMEATQRLLVAGVIGFTILMPVVIGFAMWISRRSGR